MGVLGGVLLLGFGVWLAIDAVVEGTGRTPWLALAWLLLAAPLVFAFGLRPVVYAGDTRMLVRNPFRTITIPWAKVESIESRFSTEVVADGTKYQLWAVPVSMRARKRADRRASRAAAPGRGGGAFGRGGGSDPFGRRGGTDPFGRASATRPEEPSLAYSDQAVLDLRDLAERHADAPGADAPVTSRWAYEIFATAFLGLVAVIVVSVV
jgi:hypothetical protein